VIVKHSLPPGYERVNGANQAPHSVEAESSVIGGVLVHPGKFSDVKPLLSPDDFYHPALRAIYEAMIDLDHRGKPIDALTVIEQMRALDTVDKLRAFNGPDYLTELMTAVVTVENIGYHARIVLGKATRRRLIERLRELQRGARDDDDLDELFERAQRELEDVRARCAPSLHAAHLTAPLDEFLGDEAEADQPEQYVTELLLPVGVPAFLAGEPKARKTYIALLWAICVASGRPLFGRYTCAQGRVLVVAEEDTQRQIRRRLWWLARGLGMSADELRALPIRIVVMAGFRLDNADQAAQLEREANGASLVVLDCLSRIHGADENDRTAMKTITLALSQLAARTGAAVLTIHHYRKAGEGDGERRPGTRMRGTGDLHALARAVIGVSKAKGELRIEAEGNYVDDLPPFAVRLDLAEEQGRRLARFVYVGEAKAADESADDHAVLAAFEAAAGPVTARELRTMVTGVREADVDRSRERLARAGTITPIRYKPPGKRQTSDRWVLTSRRPEFEGEDDA
jgi:replicative DNA helicase